jgi:hypothetical protein
MAEQHATTRPAWMLAAAAILMMAWVLLTWSQSAAADCNAGADTAGATCTEHDPWAGQQPTRD